MTEAPFRAGLFSGLVGAVGALLFVAAIVVGVAAYVGPFGVGAGTWSWADGLRPVLVDVLLFTAFALHHSLFARAGLKSAVSRIVSPALERSSYVWIASACFIGLCLAWQPVPGVAWQLPAPWHLIGLALQITGVVFTFQGSRALDVLDLAGVRQSLGLRRPAGGIVIRHGLYGLVRHPIYLGWVLMVWPAPLMTATRLVFAATSTAYLLLAIPFEERALRRTLGGSYDQYVRDVRWRVLPFVY